MQLEELRQQWQRLDRKLDRSLALETEIVRQVVMKPARRRVNRLAIWPAIDLLFCIGVLAFVAAFLSKHWRDWRLAASAITVMLSGFALLANCIYQLNVLAKLDWSGAVAGIQSSLEWLRVARIRQFKWIMLLSPLIWICGLTIGLQGLVDWASDGRVNIFDKLSPWWFAWNWVFGVLFVPLGYLAARALAKRCHRSRWWERALDDIAGNSLKTAAVDVERWASLQREDKVQQGGEADR